MNDNASNSDHSDVSYCLFYIYFYSHKVSILVANVYVYNLEEWLLRSDKKLKSSKFFKILEAASIELDFYKIQC